MSINEPIAVQLSDDEVEVLRHGLNEWRGPARCTKAMALAMGFDGLDDLYAVEASASTTSSAQVMPVGRAEQRRRAAPTADSPAITDPRCGRSRRSGLGAGSPERHVGPGG